jgi:hypothetical protein
MAETGKSRRRRSWRAEASGDRSGRIQRPAGKGFRVKDDGSAKLKKLVPTWPWRPGNGRHGDDLGQCGQVDQVADRRHRQVLTKQMNEILHAPEVRQMEGTWRGLHYLVNNTETDTKLKIRVMNITKDQLADQLEDFEGQMWDQSPMFKKLYTEEYSMFGGEPYGALIGAYEFSHHPRDVGLLRNMSGICASAHAPFIAGAAPQLFRMESWQELPNPQDLKQIVSSPDYAILAVAARKRGCALHRPDHAAGAGAPALWRGDGAGEGLCLRRRNRRQARPLRLDERRLRDGREHQPQPQAVRLGHPDPWRGIRAAR